LRLLRILQQSLDEDSITIYQKVLKVLEVLNREKLREISNLRHKFLIQLEIISILLMYRRVNKVQDLLKEMKEDYQIEMIEQGVLGMRTKWQQKPLPQFHLSIQQSNNELSLASSETHKTTQLIELLKLDDDTRLEMIKFLDEKQNEHQQLSSTIQNLVLLSVRQIEISQPRDKLADEEIQPYLRVLLTQQNGPWILRLNSLLMNIKLEANHRRTVERSLRQCEDIVQMINNANQDIQASSIQRLSYIFSSFMTPRYQIEKRLADLMVSLGLIKGALDIYLRIQEWEDVIGCYTQLQLRHKAAEIIQQELEKQPTVKLYCMLGDATDEVSYYEKAWEFSKQKSGIAQRHWGNYYFAKHEYENAIPHLQKSVEINSIQETTWLRLGYAALTLEKYELAASAYVRYTQIEPSGFEAWNNLAKCHIKLGNKPKAHKVLNESLKCNFDNWKVWENFLIVSIDVGSFDDALNSYNRLIELKEKFFDEEVLKILVKAIADNLTDSEGLATSRLRKKALELLAHLGSLYPSEGIVWELSASLTTEPLKRAEKLQKAHKGFVSVSLHLFSSSIKSLFMFKNLQKNSDWTKDEKMALKILQIDEQLCIESLDAATKFEEREKMLVLSQLSSARLTAQGSVKVATMNEWESCRDSVNHINILLEQIVCKIKELK
jgi:tetratricopeptide (TPR) repeat protein